MLPVAGTAVTVRARKAALPAAANRIRSPTFRTPRTSLKLPAAVEVATLSAPPPDRKDVVCGGAMTLKFYRLPGAGKLRPRPSRWPRAWRASLRA